MYAEGTVVAVAKTRGEIETTLTRYGADAMLSGFEPGTAWVQFRAKGRIVKFSAPLPVRAKYKTVKQYEQAERTRWRALLLVIKAKLESIESGIETFDEAFMPHIVLPDGQTVKEWMQPQIALAFERGAMPKLLTGPANASRAR
jgi:hypothetical protein